MSSIPPQLRTAGGRESGVACTACRAAVGLGEAVAVCSVCGAVHHAACWQSRGGCQSYDCAPARRESFSAEERPLRITDDDLAGAVIPRRAPRAAVWSAPVAPSPSPTGVSRTAVAALVVAVVGVPLFGLVTGLVAIVLGAIALGGINASRRRGTALALGGILLGIADVVGWLIFLTLAMNQPAVAPVDLADFEPDLRAIEELPPAIRRAMKANVVIERKSDWGALGTSGLGSGVVVAAEDGQVVIATNRHVVDPDFAAGNSAADAAPAGAGTIDVRLCGQGPLPGRVLWIAPDGIDFALVGVPATADEAAVARWREDEPLVVGAEVFAVGNPYGLSWTHTPGTISQLRRQQSGGRRIRVIQTDAAINPGNSGGGLYDKDGMLIGINTWTNDKRVSEGLSFAIAWESLLDLNPPHLKRSRP